MTICITNFYTELLHAVLLDGLQLRRRLISKISLRSSRFGTVGLGTWVGPKIETMVLGSKWLWPAGLPEAIK